MSCHSLWDVFSISIVSLFFSFLSYCDFLFPLSLILFSIVHYSATSPHGWVSPCIPLSSLLYLQTFSFLSAAVPISCCPCSSLLFLCFVPVQCQPCSSAGFTQSSPSPAELPFWSPTHSTGSKFDINPLIQALFYGISACQPIFPSTAFICHFWNSTWTTPMLPQVQLNPAPLPVSHPLLLTEKSIP